MPCVGRSLIIITRCPICLMKAIFVVLPLSFEVNVFNRNALILVITNEVAALHRINYGSLHFLGRINLVGLFALGCSTQVGNEHLAQSKPSVLVDDEASYITSYFCIHIHPGAGFIPRIGNSDLECFGFNGRVPIAIMTARSGPLSIAIGVGNGNFAGLDSGDFS